MKLDVSSLEKALKSLDEALQNAQDEKFMNSLTESQKRLVISGVIQNFEFTYEAACRMIRRQLEESLQSREEADRLAYRDMIRTAAETGLLDGTEKWFEFRELRNITSHTYDAEKAGSVFKISIEFAPYARRLLKELLNRNA